MYRPSRDTVFNLHELAYDTDFVHHITTFPDLSVILYHPDLVNIFKSLLRPNSPTQQVSYDTTFNLGDSIFQRFSFARRISRDAPSFLLLSWYTNASSRRRTVRFFNICAVSAPSWRLRTTRLSSLIKRPQSPTHLRPIFLRQLHSCVGIIFYKWVCLSLNFIVLISQCCGLLYVYMNASIDFVCYLFW